MERNTTTDRVEDDFQFELSPSFSRWKEEESLKGVATHIFVLSVFDLNYKNIYG
jgi:hypothetical protein